MTHSLIRIWGHSQTLEYRSCCVVAVAETAFKSGLTRRMRRHIYRVVSDSLTVCFVCLQHNTLASLDRYTHCRIDNRQLQNHSPIATGVASGDYR